ncbi:2-amino-4-hydroxy-6-hydroxymethyldihydropteridine diphosphokinase [Thermoactinomyces sp. DSM 45892]|uniref:2-amino-4-hydroxy-6- hydroxymethyldihydropteridine diphosphokinase n=1 Tax=Thermoactinomyces sp. DSM 45892 TaxID=1882753 RepID=UPI000898A638|nr:2-amino-4-hydroxy-6-hydroxymethyldihydropteridine diphosphokinase [Thermoactinomyces sp. DSM 45892]SDY94460.1 2-amino-4-hydroxy-6-hydroxymethyldihydropteridinediphosphokinase [Thermoactinomyces sp. DSM 45892]
MVRAYVGLGANIGDPVRQLKQAIRLIQDTPDIQVRTCSSIYRSDPVDYLNQPDFYNMVAELETTLSAEALLRRCQEVEQELKRVRVIRYGPRTIDIDILLYDQLLIQKENLEVPHPKMKDRSFVVLPLAEVVGDTERFLIPGTSESLGDWVKQIGNPRGILKLEPMLTKREEEKTNVENRKC